MAPFGFGKKNSKPPRKDPREREKQAGAREYEARHQDRLAERLESQGDVEGARVAREAAAAARATPKSGR
jgi:hypothetical protein